MSKQHTTFPPTLYRSRRGWVFGVCKGLATYSQIGVGWIRLMAVIAMMLTGFWPIVIIYIMAAIFMKPAPLVAPENAGDWEFYNSYTSDRKMALLRLKDKFDRLERRTRRIEAIVTTPEYQWDRKLNS